MRTDPISSRAPARTLSFGDRSTWHEAGEFWIRPLVRSALLRGLALLDLHNDASFAGRLADGWSQADPAPIEERPWSLLPGIDDTTLAWLHDELRGWWGVAWDFVCLPMPDFRNFLDDDTLQGAASFERALRAAWIHG